MNASIVVQPIFERIETGYRRGGQFDCLSLPVQERYRLQSDGPSVAHVGDVLTNA